MSEMRTAGHNYIPGIDGLRAIAIFLVVAFHAFPALAPGGFVGRRLFRDLGLSITRLLVTALEEQKFSLVDFYVRRARRILPAFALVCVLRAGSRRRSCNFPTRLTSFGQSLMAAFRVCVERLLPE